MRIGIVAGEASGDILGAGLISAIKQKYPDAVFEGIAGPGMIEQGAQSLFPMDRLSVMGLTEVFGRYLELLGVRKQLAEHFIANPPDVFIAIDAPDFNLGLELKLRRAGIKTVHYVSPSVWAWRQYRIKKIARAVDLMLTLFPFEAEFYRQHNVPVTFVGHPLADMIELEPDQAAYRAQLQLPVDKKIVAILPGSRSTELRYLADDFLQTASWLLEREPDLHFVAPMANAHRREQFEAAMGRLNQYLPLTILDGQSRAAMAAADVVLLASGTAALEAMLLKKPMVVAYRVAPITYWVYKPLVRVSNFCLPNLLAGERLVSEFIQHDLTPQALGAALLDFLQQPQHTQQLAQRFLSIHETLKCNANEQAAKAILSLVEAA